MREKRKSTTILVLSSVSVILILAGAVFLFYPGQRSGIGFLGRDGQGETAEDSPVPKATQDNLSAEVVGVEVYDLSSYLESSQEYAAALEEREERWFPRQAIVMPAGSEGGALPNAPLAIYDAYPGQVRIDQEGDSYSKPRTWIGDIAVGTQVTILGLIPPGEWCFVSTETLGGWRSSGWVWCYRLFIPE